MFKHYITESTIWYSKITCENDGYKSGVTLYERDLSTTELHRKCDGELRKFKHVRETKLIRDINAAGAIRSGSIDLQWQLKN